MEPKKRKLAALALAGVFTVSAISGIASAAPGDKSAPDGIGAQELIVKFRDAKALAAEIDAIEEVYRSSNIGAVEARRRAISHRPDLENLMSDEGRNRAFSLSREHRAAFLHKRVLANGADLLKVSTDQASRSMQALVQELRDNPAVEYAEVNAIMKPLLTPNDTHYGAQWHYSEATAGLNLPAAWDVATGTGAVVAVLDTGITNHSDLNANVIAGYDFISDSSAARDGNGRDSDASDEGDWWTNGECGPSAPVQSDSSWHGTHVAGTVAAVTNNNSGVAGVAFNAKIMPVRVLGKCGGTLADIADAIVWASGGTVSGVPNTSTPADVINMSLGGGGSCGSTYQAAINTAVGNGTVVVVAAGNENQNASNSRPANCSSVVSVAALDRQGNRASYSNYGSVIDVSAPGGETSPTASNGVASTLNSGSTTPASENYVYYQGTSMATPHVAGVAALMKGLDSSLTPAAVEASLKSTARAIPGSCSGGCGSGLVDALAAVNDINGGGPPPGGGGPTALNNGDSVSNISGSTGDWVHYKISVPAGATNLNVSISGGSGDADLYVRQGAEPTTSSYDCRPYLVGNNESCDFASPAADDYFIGIRAYSTYSGVTLSVSYTEPGSGGTGGGGTVEDISASRGSWKRYTLEVPAGMSQLEVEISGGSGDADLYVRFGAQPTTGSYDCRPYLSGNNEVCTFSNPAAGTWHIGIRAYRTFSGVTLDAYYSP